jgi:hypothetical protein
MAIAVTFFELFGISNWGFAAAVWFALGVKRRRISVQCAALSRPIIAADYTAAGRQAASHPALLSPRAGERFDPSCSAA